MAGIFGGDPLDRAREIELDKHLDYIGKADRREARIDARVEDIWDSMQSIVCADRLENDYEVITGIASIVLLNIACARDSKDYEFACRALIGMVDALIKQIAIQQIDQEGYEQ
jgi:hypothetical protein